MNRYQIFVVPVKRANNSWGWYGLQSSLIIVDALLSDGPTDLVKLSHYYGKERKGSVPLDASSIIFKIDNLDYKSRGPRSKFKAYLDATQSLVNRLNSGEIITTANFQEIIRDYVETTLSQLYKKLPELCHVNFTSYPCQKSEEFIL